MQVSNVQWKGKIQLVTFTPLNSHADLTPVTMTWHQHSAAAGLKLTEITEDKGSCGVTLAGQSVARLPDHEIEEEKRAEVALAVPLCCNKKKNIFMIWMMSVCLSLCDIVK